MNEAEFRAGLEADGYQIMKVTWAAGRVNDSHAHDFHAKLMCVEGTVQITTSEGETAYKPGDQFAVPAGTTHRESVGPKGAKLVVGRKY